MAWLIIETSEFTASAIIGLPFVLTIRLYVFVPIQEFGTVINQKGIYGNWHKSSPTSC